MPADQIAASLYFIIIIIILERWVSNLTILGQQKHSKSSACVSDCDPDVAGEDVQEEMPLRTVITSVGLQP
jgi:hypothetical protein